MKKNKFKIILLLSFFNFSQYQSQTNISEKQIYNIATPEVATMMRYVDFPEPDFIGKTNISVPIYDINFGNLKIPIGLSYNTKGNKASDIATSVGLGWNLNAGGNLTVKINDMNDLTENYAFYTDGTFEPEQSYAWHRQTKGYLSTDYPQALSDTQVPSSQLCMNTRIWSSDDRNIDTAPDFYYLNVPGLNDKFYLTRINDSQVKANFFTSNAKLNNNLNFTIKTTCSGLESTAWGNQGAATVFYQPDKFEITGENGYIYTFNDNDASIIWEYPLDFSSHNTQQVNNWYLTKIKDPFSGKEITFEYESFTNTYDHLSLLSLFNYFDFGSYATSYLSTTRPGRDETLGRVANRLVSSRLVPKRLKRITTDKEVLDFNYDIIRLDYGGNALSGILVKNKNGNIVKQYNFTYSYFDNGTCSAGAYECKRLRLETMNDSSLGKYSFYYDNNVFPPRNTSKVDFLGYFNNNSSNISFSKTDYHPFDFNYYPITKTYFYPELAKDNIFPFQLRNKVANKISREIDRTPSTGSQLGLLKKMVYPTGGSLDLSYENDDFMYEGEKYILGSTRVNSMKLYDSQNIVSKEIKYKYINADNTSSGQINFIKTPDETSTSEISSGIGFNTDAVIGYSRIIEETTGKGYVEKKYTNFNDYPDQFMQPDQNITNQAHKNFIKFMKFPSSYVQSFDDRRGKLLSVNYYKEGQSIPLKKEEYTYDYQVKNSLKITKPFYYGYSTGYDEFSASNYFLTYFNTIKNSTKEELFSGSSVKEENNFSYDGARLISKKTISGGDTTEEFYRNAKDKSIQKLINANILDIPVEVEKRKNGKVLSKQETKYENSSNILPSSIISYGLDNINTSTTEITYDKYDSKGNLLQYTAKNSIPVTVIWGYRQNQPIAKIEGATYSQIMQAYGLNINDNNSYLNLDIVKKSDLHFDSATEIDLLSNLKDFRNKQEFKGYNVSTYTHAPLIGVKSITPQNGVKESYTYDVSNKLEKVLDKDNNILKEYKYNIAPTTYYNVEKSQAFTRNNCGPGTLPEVSIYKVPLGSYSSLISQADADQKAQNDINTNGQVYVNTHGVCTPYVCTITPSSNVQIYYSSFQEMSANHIKAILSFPTSGTNLNWSGGVFIGTLQSLCAPNSYKNISSNGWTIS
ncbi:DUF5977 domain-containing protein, partial [Chryseobacterium sp. JK1]|uniref:DUF5977 domain-containing protein n=1 Tax=Chryseobacterium sp. JK1 TaxID=874294 RepID=UPI003D68B331